MGLAEWVTEKFGYQDFYVQVLGVSVDKVESRDVSGRVIVVDHNPKSIESVVDYLAILELQVWPVDGPEQVTTFQSTVSRTFESQTTPLVAQEMVRLVFIEAQKYLNQEPDFKYQLKLRVKDGVFQLPSNLLEHVLMDVGSRYLM